MSDELLARLRSALSERYTIERELGRGGMATVWLGEDRKFPRAVAIKVLHPELATILGVDNGLGRTADALASLELALATSGRHPWAVAALGICYHSLGKLGDVQALRDELAARARREHVQRAWLGALSAALGRMDEAFELLDQACEERDGILPYSKRYPFFALLQQDPRMQRIYRRVGLPE